MMPWYKFTAHHGAGHQSKSEKLEFYEKPIPKEDLEEMWQEWMNGRYFTESAIGDVVLMQNRDVSPQYKKNKIANLMKRAEELVSLAAVIEKEG